MISICFILLLLISILTTSYGQVTCASGWVQNGGSCYLFNYSDRSWDECHAYCPTSYPGATMLCVNNAAENNWIASKTQGNSMWIGYTDMPPYGGGKGTLQYGWVTGCSSTYTSWDEIGEPNNMANSQDYAAVYLNAQWSDFSPFDKFPCGCEFNPASQGSVSE
jgi:hypothetical protein